MHTHAYAGASHNILHTSTVQYAAYMHCAIRCIYALCNMLHTSTVQYAAYKHCAICCIQALCNMLHTSTVQYAAYMHCAICCIQALCNTSQIIDTHFILFHKLAQSTQTTHWAITPSLQWKSRQTWQWVGQWVCYITWLNSKCYTLLTVALALTESASRRS